MLIAAAVVPIVPMVALGSALTIGLALVLLGAAFFLRSPRAHPWAAIMLATLTAAVCFTVGGESALDSDGPSLATVLGAGVGLVSIVAGAMALVPRSSKGPASPVPNLLASAAIVVGAGGLLVGQLLG